MLPMLQKMQEEKISLLTAYHRMVKNELDSLLVS